MTSADYPITRPTEPGRYEAEGFPVADDYVPYVIDAAGIVTEESVDAERCGGYELSPGEWDEIVEERGPFRRIPTSLVGLIGKKRTGKNRTAQELARHGFTEAAFADPLRDMALAIDPVVGWEEHEPVYYSDALDVHGYEAAKELYPEFRRFLQRLGTEGVRDTLGGKHGLRDILGDDVWIVLAEHRIDAAETPLVFTDVRFPNEAALIERKGGKTVRIVRSGLPASTDEHASETALDDYAVDIEIDNDGTPDGLAAEVDSLTAIL